MAGLREAAKASAMLIALLLIVAAFSQLLRTALWPELRDSYRHSFSWTPGSHFGGAMVALRTDARGACVILGNSAAREALDPLILSSVDPKLMFLNAATTGGNNMVFELQARLLAAHGVRPRCTILAMNSWNMFSNGPPQIVTDDYLALLGWDDLAALSYSPFLTREGPRVAAGLVLPLKPQGKQINRVLRQHIWAWRVAGGEALPLSRLAYFAGELDSPQPYLYAGKTDILATQRAALVARNREYYDPARYGGRKEKESLAATLNTLSRVSDDTTIVILPQSPILERASRVADPSFRAAIAPYRSRIRLIDCSAVNSSIYFHDEGHLNARGRLALSKALATALVHGDDPSASECVALYPGG
ncbi:hypothetical protein CDQ92_19100 [Sphingopyxis bauzanensis]|uniref:Uncharacterized protein n=2 Tax=Sphingopyxis bauzanensis TaxID=651663 RepID=A0A246JNB9_9SPHN|nr:hypothetical protein CDQ92_19100 [Sphingopyxis bauzanensis]GGJ63875.1 hypothetical protein GCM10011393_37770 [Sphingopyxis bauzanensis]